MDDIKNKLTWFHRNLTIQLDDIELTHAGYTIQTFFDTVDIRDAVMGMHAYLVQSASYRKDLNDFRQTKTGDTTLVHSLLTSGILGTVKMLPPHQAEFLGLLNIDLGVGRTKDNSLSKAQELLDKLIAKKILEPEALPAMGMSHKALLEYTMAHVESALSFFKFVELVQHIAWESRLRHYVTNKILHFDSPNFDYLSLSQREEFIFLKGELNKERPEPDKRINNLADAFAICTLLQFVEKVREQASKVIPIFFVSTPLMKHVLHSPRVTQFLDLTVEGKSHSVMRNVDYFVFKGTFNPSSDQKLYPVNKAQNIEGLRELHQKLSELLDAQEPLSLESLKRIMVRGKPLVEILDDIRTLTFYENIWLPFSRSRQSQSILAQIGDQAKQLQSEEFKRAVEENLANVKADLERNVREYKWFSKVWQELDHAKKTFKDDYTRIRETIKDEYWQFGLIRFNLAEEGKTTLHNLIDSMLSGDEVAETAALNYILSIIISCRQKGEVKQEDLTACIAILWIFRLDQLNIYLLGSTKTGPYEHLGVLTAAILRAQTDLEKAKTNIGLLIQRFEDAANIHDKGNLAVIIAYLYFHYWKAQGHSAQWRPQTAIAPHHVTDGYEFIEAAIRYAKIAFELIPFSQKKRVYVLNQLLYYMVEGGAPEMLGAMESAATSLVPYGSFKHGGEFWQFRFDDTLARYYHLLAVFSKDEQTWLQMMNTAETHLNKAIQAGLYDEEISNYQRELQAYRALGFRNN